MLSGGNPYLGTSRLPRNRLGTKLPDLVWQFLGQQNKLDRNLDRRVGEVVEQGAWPAGDSRWSRTKNNEMFGCPTPFFIAIGGFALPVHFAFGSELARQVADPKLAYLTAAATAALAGCSE